MLLGYQWFQRSKVMVGLNGTGVSVVPQVKGHGRPKCYWGISGSKVMVGLNATGVSAFRPEPSTSFWPSFYFLGNKLIPTLCNVFGDMRGHKCRRTFVTKVLPRAYFLSIHSHFKGTISALYGQHLHSWAPPTWLYSIVDNTLSNVRGCGDYSSYEVTWV